MKISDLAEVQDLVEDYKSLGNTIKRLCEDPAAHMGYSVTVRLAGHGGNPTAHINSAAGKAAMLYALKLTKTSIAERLERMGVEV